LQPNNAIELKFSEITPGVFLEYSIQPSRKKQKAKLNREKIESFKEQ